MSYYRHTVNRLERRLLRLPPTVYGPLCCAYGYLIAYCAERVFA